MLSIGFFLCGMLFRMRFMLVFLTLVLPFLVSAHVTSLPVFTPADTFVTFLIQGVHHIVPLGLDHVCFIITVYLVSKNLRDIVRNSFVFTAAHSCTLALVVLNVVSVPSYIIEPIIALSIFALAIDVLNPYIKFRWHSLVIFIFGLVHGLGFAGALHAIDLSGRQLLWVLAGFNIGVEIGQLFVIILLLLITHFVLRNSNQKVMVYESTALVIALVSLLWFIERLVS
jgi:hydrogenase/urease accessory protein HupE